LRLSHGDGERSHRFPPVRGVFVLVLVAMALLAGASSASAVIARLPGGKTLSYQPLRGPAAVRPFDAFFSNLDYNGGPVMPSNTNYVIYWSPSGASAYPSDYQGGVNRYFEDLAHDSGGAQNVDSVSSQYNDAAGEFANYNSHFGGALVDTAPYPANGCFEAAICLTDEQLGEELTKFVKSHGLPTDLAHEYFLLTPPGVEDCFDESGAECSAGSGAPEYCAYHSNIPLGADGELIYSNDPYVTGNLGCDEPKNHPNGTTSDGVLIGGLSHEHNESTTDPEPNNAWTDFGGSGGENGDKCRTLVKATEFGTQLGEVEVEEEGKKHKAKYNQVINGHFYWYQQEWSNKGNQCLQRLTFKAEEAPTATFTSTDVEEGNELKLDATGSTTGAEVRYNWQFNDFAGRFPSEPVETGAVKQSHLFPSAGTYTVALTVFKKDGTSSGTAKQLVVGKTQTVAFTSSSPSSATIGGSTYAASATATSGLPVVLTVDPPSSSACAISGSTVSFIGMGTCVIDANQKGNTSYNPAPQQQQAVPVGKGSQAITFTSTPPGSATMGGSPYAASAVATSGLAVTVTIDAASGSVCSIAGSTVSFIGPGTCTIDANQAGNASYNAAPRAQQSFPVQAGSSGLSPLATPPVSPTGLIAVVPNSSFSPLHASFNPKTGVITFKGSASNPGTFTWLLTFQNGKFGVFAASTAKCKKGFVRLKGKCRPSTIVFARGSKALAAPGTVTFTVKPSASALRALKTALKQKKGLPVSVRLTFQSSRGGSAVTHTQAVTVKLKK
jgi:hypothetical protein